MFCTGYAPLSQDTFSLSLVTYRYTNVILYLLTFLEVEDGFAEPTQLAAGSWPRDMLRDAVQLVFASGCFWARQHSMVSFERSKLGRLDSAITSVAGYFGGTSTGAKSQVCHYNAEHVAEYSSLGYAEAVPLDVPASSVAAAARFFFDGFVEISPGIWAREDIYDVGPAYRAAIGLPGGYDSPLLAQLQAANFHNMTLVRGSIHSTSDTFGTNSVYILDSNELNFHQAELCLQFHNPQGATFPPSYRALTQVLVNSGRLRPSAGCPIPYDCNITGR